ncbi:MAG: hypothetical protein AB7V48_02720 [Sedimentibacter sp.]
MKKISYLIFILITILLLCGCNNPTKTEEADSIQEDKTEHNISKPDIDIADDTTQQNTSNSNIKVDNEDSKSDKMEHLTGEIITDGFYVIYEERGYSTLAFIPDKESLEVMVDKYNERQNYILAYDELEKVKDLPKELGIYKVKVKIDRVDDYGYLFIDSIELTDDIGTVLYEGETFETNDLDDTVNVNKKAPAKIHLLSSDRYDYIVKSKENESDFILSTDGFNMTTGNTEVRHDLICKIKENGALVDVKVVEADEIYKNIFELNNGEVIRLIDDRNDFVVVSVDKTDESLVIKSSDYYYVNKNSLNKVYLFSSDEYDYQRGLVLNENQFILLSKRPIRNDILEVHHGFICNITESDAIVEKTDDLNIDRNIMDTSGMNFIIQGCITEIKIEDKAVILTLKDIKMREKDLLTYGDISEDGFVEIQLYNYNRGGPDIRIGDNITATCRYTIDNKIIYAAGAEIKIIE